MMRSIKVKEGQTLLDVAIEHCGDASAVYEIADANTIGITDDLNTGQTLFIPAVMVQAVVDLLAPAHLKPASAESLADSELLEEGLEFWRIEQDFVIS